jgi:hypothetical protein
VAESVKNSSRAQSQFRDKKKLISNYPRKTKSLVTLGSAMKSKKFTEMKNAFRIVTNTMLTYKAILIPQGAWRRVQKNGNQAERKKGKMSLSGN